jgi:selenocysteine lyase/cysteine desulfurase
MPDMIACSDTLLDGFEALLAGPDRIRHLREGLIGDDVVIPGPFGPRRMVYADHVASGRALRQVEEFVARSVLPFYANSHTQASWCGQYVTRLREAARRRIARLVNAGAEHSVIFAGSGATAGLNRLVWLLGIGAKLAEGGRAIVFVGPYEHHSNILPWRESGAEVVEIAEAPSGGPDLDMLDAALAEAGPESLRIGAFSAASNVTGILTDVAATTEVLKRQGALAVWDFAGGGPYLPIDMQAGGGLDAVVVSPHKFAGGPAASGILVVRKAAVSTRRPTWPGGGTVAFVSGTGHDYSTDLAAREEAGTPNVVGDIRAALAFVVKEVAGQAFIDRRHEELVGAASASWRTNPHLELLGTAEVPRLPIFSFRVRSGDGGHVHHQLVTRMLSDHFGIQARGGCACAGPYAHRLLDIDATRSAAIRAAIARGDEMDKPGWTRLNFSYLIDDAKAAFIIASVDDLARRADSLAAAYEGDPTTARFAAILPDAA